MTKDIKKYNPMIYILVKDLPDLPIGTAFMPVRGNFTGKNYYKPIIKSKFADWLIPEKLMKKSDWFKPLQSLDVKIHRVIDWEKVTPDQIIGDLK